MDLISSTTSEFVRITQYYYIIYHVNIFIFAVTDKKLKTVSYE